MFDVIDGATGATLSTHKSRAIANRVIDRRNAAHGAYRFYVRATDRG